MKVETHPPLCLAVVGIRRREIAVQVRDRNLYTTNRQNDSEALVTFTTLVVSLMVHRSQSREGIL